MPRVAGVRKVRGHWVSDAGGVRVKLAMACDSRAVALAALKQHIENLEYKKVGRQRAGLVANVDRLTVRAVAALFLEHKSRTTPGKLAWYVYYCQRFVEFCGDVKIEKLRAPMGDEFKAFIEAQPTIKSPTTVGHYIQVAKAVLNFGVDSDFIAKSPWRRLKKPAARRRKRLVTDEEFNKLLVACDESREWRGMTKEEVGITMKDALRLLRATAMRPSVARKLRWDQVFMERRLIIITTHKTSETAKVREPWEIPLIDEAMEVLERRKKAYGHFPYVFSMDGKSWMEDGFCQRFKRVRARAGLDTRDQNGEMISLYHLRHARISEMVFVEKVPLAVVQKVANHTDISTTIANYSHITSEDFVREIQEGRMRGMEKQKGTAD